MVPLTFIKPKYMHVVTYDTYDDYAEIKRDLQAATVLYDSVNDAVWIVIQSREGRKAVSK